MTTNNNETNKPDKKLPPMALLKPVRQVSNIWLVPIIAVLIGAWMVYYNWSNQGPLITIEFITASGIEVGKTKIKARNVDVGVVKTISLKESLDGVIVTARLSKNTENLLTESTKFWVVEPKVSSAGISGLNTILSGPYIELHPGTGEAGAEHFIGLEDAPLTPVGTPGQHITLDSDDDFSFSAGDPIIYKGFKVGKIEDIHFNSYQGKMYYNAFVEAPYHNLLNSNSHFWKVSGVQVDVSADGLKLQTGTLESLISGGVAFAVPTDLPIGKPITERAFFKIYPSYTALYDQRYKLSLKYVLLIEDSIRGLSVGAPVDFRGITVGRVLQTNIPYKEVTNILNQSTGIPVLISLEPGRLGLTDDQASLQTAKTDIQNWIQQGLRATLQSGNLLTGSQLVQLQYYDDQPLPEENTFNDYPVIPIVPNDFSMVSAKISELFDKFNKLPIKSVVNNADKLLTEGVTTLTTLQKTVSSLDKILSSVSEDKIPHNLNTTLDEIKELARGFSEGSPTYDELRYTLESLNNALQELKPLLNHLKNRPNGLIFSEQNSENIEPKGGH